MAHRGFWRELKRRNVPRAAVLYAGAMWLLAQVITQLGPVLNAPAWIARAFLIAVAVGFPFWIAFAWFYEWTPQGLKRESEIAADDSIARSTGRKLDRSRSCRERNPESSFWFQYVKRAGFRIRSGGAPRNDDGELKRMGLPDSPTPRGTP